MPLYPYQIEGVKALIQKKRFLLRDEPGLGKTCQLISGTNVIQAEKYRETTSGLGDLLQKVMKVLVICPKSMCITWQREIDKWGKGSTEYTVINHDRLIAKEAKTYLRHWDLVIADESHMYLKNGNTQRARMFAQVIEKAERVWLATATVASRSGEDYYTTLRILLPDMKWHKGNFIHRYCNKVEDPWTYSGFKYEGFNNTEELNKILSVCSLRRTEEEVALQLPELTETDMYVEGEVNSITASGNKDILEAIKAGKALPYQEELKEVGLKKIPSVIELLQTYPPDKKVVIFAWHKEVIAELHKAILKECPDRIVEVINSDNPDPDDKKKDAFQTGSCNTLEINMQSGGAGITLTAATVGIYVQFPHSVIHWVQSRKRIHRIGSKKPVQIIKLMIEGSIDEDIFAVLTERAKYIKEIEG